MRRSLCALGLCAVGATLVVAPLLVEAVDKLGDHEGRPYGG